MSGKKMKQLRKLAYQNLNNDIYAGKLTDKTDEPIHKEYKRVKKAYRAFRSTDQAKIKTT